MSNREYSLTGARQTRKSMLNYTCLTTYTATPTKGKPALQRAFERVASASIKEVALTMNIVHHESYFHKSHFSQHFAAPAAAFLRRCLWSYVTVGAAAISLTGEREGGVR